MIWIELTNLTLNTAVGSFGYSLDINNENIIFVKK